MSDDFMLIQQKKTMMPIYNFINTITKQDHGKLNQSKF